MIQNKATLKNLDLAKQLIEATLQFENHLISLLEKSKGIETQENSTNFAHAVGNVLATLGESIYFPIYREHPSLAPEQLKDIFKTN